MKVRINIFCERFCIIKKNHQKFVKIIIIKNVKSGFNYNILIRILLNDTYIEYNTVKFGFQLRNIYKNSKMIV